MGYRGDGMASFEGKEAFRASAGCPLPTSAQGPLLLLLAFIALQTAVDSAHPMYTAVDSAHPMYTHHLSCPGGGTDAGTGATARDASSLRSLSRSRSLFAAAAALLACACSAVSSAADPLPRPATPAAAAAASTAFPVAASCSLGSAAACASDSCTLTPTTSPRAPLFSLPVSPSACAATCKCRRCF